jgi:hypothetical protein
MILEKIKNLQVGDVLYWAEGKNHFKGKFKRYSGDVLDYKVLCVETDDGNEDEILHIFLIDEEVYLRETQKTFKPSFVKNKIEKKEEIDDETIENVESEQKIENNTSIESKEIKSPVEIDNQIQNKVVKKVTKNTVSADELKPTLKNLDNLLQKEGCRIERDDKKWVKYHLFLSDGNHVEIIYKGKVWELYNIYVEHGLKGLVNII